ncbi:gene transfer agent family protein [Paracoccus sp. MBLB3053]|uniref:Gene transfer agent family protein n=1 Tax=Paracoccus aurantius TaxID=3073814 RepID=A0ABU2HLV7_9RHOB|nr:gene transfer agent family protein [Paracoccus sp. MBLB3053]MDS9466017.1 gene transfer agent family protein [Paracoccus sp. MBLB3053]
MVNPWRGEVEVVLNDQSFPARLTLGALAELETELGAKSMIELIERFETGQFSSHDVIAVIVAGLRGGGWEGERSNLLNSELRGGPMEAAKLAATLLARAFRLEGA